MRRWSSTSPAGSEAGCRRTWTRATSSRTGCSGLIGAIERYDPDRDVKFETYAISRIKGAIIDELRAMDWVPRSVRARARRDRTRDCGARGEAPPGADRRGDRRQARDHGRGARGQPHRDLPLVDRRARRALDDFVRRRRPGRPDRHDRGHPGAGAAVGPRPDGAQEALGEAIARLPEREKLVITLYYYEELTLREIGEVLGVTESRVSQLHTKAMLRLKARLGGVRSRARRVL